MMGDPEKHKLGPGFVDEHGDTERQWSEWEDLEDSFEEEPRHRRHRKGKRDGDDQMER